MSHSSDSSGIAPPRLAVAYDSFKEFVEHSSDWLLKSRIFLETDRPLPLGTSVRAEIALRDGPILIRALGHIAEVVEAASEEGQLPGVALQIAYLDPASARLIDSILKRHGKQEGKAFAITKSFPSPEGAVMRGIPKEPSGKVSYFGTEGWAQDVGSFVDGALRDQTAPPTATKTGAAPATLRGASARAAERAFAQRREESAPAEAEPKSSEPPKTLAATQSLKVDPPFVVDQPLESDQPLTMDPSLQEDQPPEADQPAAPRPDEDDETDWQTVDELEVAPPGATASAGPESGDDTFFDIDPEVLEKPPPEDVAPPAPEPPPPPQQSTPRAAQRAEGEVAPAEEEGQVEAPEAKAAQEQIHWGWEDGKQQETSRDEAQPDGAEASRSWDQLDLAEPQPAEELPQSPPLAFAMKAKGATSPRRGYLLALFLVAVLAAGFFFLGPDLLDRARGLLAAKAPAAAPATAGASGESATAAAAEDSTPEEAAAPAPATADVPEAAEPPPQEDREEPAAVRDAAAEPPVAAVEPPVAAAEPPVAAAEPPAAAGQAAAAGDPEEEVRSHVEAWARAWSEQRVDDFIACYAEGYAPAGLSRETWMRQRRERIRAPARISVRLADVEVTLLEAERARVKFRQFYETESMNRRTTKIQELRRQPRGGWKIVQERRAN